MKSPTTTHHCIDQQRGEWTSLKYGARRCHWSRSVDARHRNPPLVGGNASRGRLHLRDRAHEECPQVRSGEDARRRENTWAREESVSMFFLQRSFFRSLSHAPVPAQALRPHATAHAARAAIRLVAGAAEQRESARFSCSAGSGPPPWHSPCSGSSSNDVAKARCAATERMPLQRCTQAPRAVTRRAACAAAARARASRRTNCAASRE